MVSIDGTDISGVTIDGTDVQEITVDGDVVWTAKKIVDSFEDGNISEYEGDLGAFTTDSGSSPSPTDGSYQLRCTSGFNQITSTTGLDYYPSQGDTIEVDLYVNGSSICELWLGCQSEEAQPSAYRFRIESNEIRIMKRDGTNNSKIASKSVNLSNGYHRCRMTWGNPTLTWKVLSSGDTISADDTDYTSGGIGWGGQSGVYYDYLWIL